MELRKRKQPLPKNKNNCVEDHLTQEDEDQLSDDCINE